MKSTLPRDAVFLCIVTEDKEQDEVDCSTVFCDLGQFWARSWEGRKPNQQLILSPDEPHNPMSYWNT